MDGYSLDLTGGARDWSASAGPYIGGQIAAAEKAGGVSAAAATMVRSLDGSSGRSFAALAWLRKQGFVQPSRIGWRETRLVASKLCWE